MLSLACSRLMMSSQPRQKSLDWSSKTTATIFYLINHDVAVHCDMPGMHRCKVTGGWRGYAGTFLISAQGITLMPIGLHRHV